MADNRPASGKPFTTPAGLVDSPVDEAVENRLIAGDPLHSPQDNDGPVTGRE